MPRALNVHHVFQISRCVVPVKRFCNNGKKLVRSQTTGQRYKLTLYTQQGEPVVRLNLDETGRVELYANATHRKNGAGQILPVLRDALERQVADVMKPTGSLVEICDVRQHPQVPGSLHVPIHWADAGMETDTAALVAIAARRAMLQVA